MTQPIAQLFTTLAHNGIHPREERTAKGGSISTGLGSVTVSVPVDIAPNSGDQVMLQLKKSADSNWKITTLLLDRGCPRFAVDTDTCRATIEDSCPQ